jgi:hypothetical protein
MKTSRDEYVVLNKINNFAELEKWSQFVFSQWQMQDDS